MPVKSKAQLAKFKAMLYKGEIDEKTYQEWTRGVVVSKLPNRVSKQNIKKVKAIK